MWIVLVFWFAIYAIIVKIGLLIYGKLYGNKNILDKPQKWEDYIVKNTKFPIVIENDYLLETQIALRIFLLLVFSFFISSNLLYESDSLNEIYRRLGLVFGLFGLVFTIATRNKMSYKLFTNKLYIKELDDKITYDYVTEQGEIKTDVIEKNQIYSVKWSYLPYAVRYNKIWLTEDNKDDLLTYLVMPLLILLVALYFLLFLCLKKFKIEKYILYRHKEGIIAIPSIVYKDNMRKITFEWKSLINTNIITGGHYAN